jgi:hypothetical protein
MRDVVLMFGMDIAGFTGYLHGCNQAFCAINSRTGDDNRTDVVICVFYVDKMGRGGLVGIATVYRMESRCSRDITPVTRLACQST